MTKIPKVSKKYTTECKYTQQGKILPVYGKVTPQVTPLVQNTYLITIVQLNNCLYAERTRCVKGVCLPEEPPLRKRYILLAPRGNSSINMYNTQLTYLPALRLLHTTLPFIPDTQVLTHTITAPPKNKQVRIFSSPTQVPYNPTPRTSQRPGGRESQHWGCESRFCAA